MSATPGLPSGNIAATNQRKYNGPISALCFAPGARNTPGGRRFVIAGRDVFRLLSITDDGRLEDVANLRPSARSSNLNYAACCVDWNPIDPMMLASGSTNGHVMLWNLTESAGGDVRKTVFELSSHTRCVNTVAWHRDGRILASGSQEGTVKLWDCRMAHLRPEPSTDGTKPTHPAVRADVPGRVEIRDIEFSPHSSELFASCLENGQIQVWDWRKCKVPVLATAAHTGIVMSLHWHPSVEGVLATGGRDRMVKTWDVRGNRAVQNTSIQTISSVGFVQWRQGYDAQVTSCSYFMEYNIHIWNTQRPSIPQYSLPGHRNFVTAARWVTPHRLVSVGKDAQVIVHEMDEAQQPIKRIGASGISWSPMNEALIFDERPNRDASTFHHVSDAPSRRGVVMAVTALDEDKPMSRWTDGVFRFLADHYRFPGVAGASGEPALTRYQACVWNARVAREAQQAELVDVWESLITVCGLAAEDRGSAGATPAVDGTRPMASELQRGRRASSSASTRPMHTTMLSAPATPSMQRYGSHETGHDVGAASPRHRQAPVGSPSLMSAAVPPLLASPAMSTPSQQQRQHALATTPVPDAFELGRAHSATSSVANGTAGPSLTMPSVASPSLHSPAFPSLSRAALMTSADALHASHTETSSSQPLSLDIAEDADEATFWSPEQIVKDTLAFYSEQGDVQTCVALFLVLGARRVPGYDKHQVETWFFMYIDLLMRHRAYATATIIINLAPMQDVRSLNLLSTTVYAACPSCSKPMVDVAWRCVNEASKLDTTTQTWSAARRTTIVNCCSLCRQVVRGLYSWCQGCGHGGHLTCMQRWFRQSHVCPTGCGHQCFLPALSHKLLHIRSSSLSAADSERWPEQGSADGEDDELQAQHNSSRAAAPACV